MKTSPNKFWLMLFACASVVGSHATNPEVIPALNTETKVKVTSLNRYRATVKQRLNQPGSVNRLNSTFVTGINPTQKQETSLFDRGLKVKFRLNRDLNVVLSYQ